MRCDVESLPRGGEEVERGRRSSACWSASRQRDCSSGVAAPKRVTRKPPLLPPPAADVGRTLRTGTVVACAGGGAVASRCGSSAASWSSRVLVRCTVAATTGCRRAGTVLAADRRPATWWKDLDGAEDDDDDDDAATGGGGLCSCEDMVTTRGDARRGEVEFESPFVCRSDRAGATYRLRSSHRLQHT
jgi:hypothetical protein